LPTARELIAERRVLIAGHRGNAIAAPENTLPSFAEAIELGAEMVELDYRHSADGIPVVFHDEKLDRATDAVARWGGREIKLADKTLAELRELDAGAWFRPQFAGTRIPTLEEALDVIDPGAVAVIERKVGDAGTLVELLSRKGMTDRVVVQAFDWPFLAECRRLAPTLAITALGEHQLTPERLAQIETLDVQAVGWSNLATTPALIDAVHQHGWKAWVWTVDSLERGRELVAAGIDAIITNAPGRLRAVVATESGS